MKQLCFAALLFLMFSCGNSGKREESPAGGTADAQPGKFTPEAQQLINSLSDLDCRIYTLFSKAMAGTESENSRKQILQLRKEKKAIIDKIMKIYPDSAQLSLVFEELQQLRDAEDYCPGLKELKLKENPSDKEGIPGQELNIREDAEKLGNLNCSILQAHKKVEAASGDAAAKKELKKLLDEKRTFLHQLMLMYGQDVLSDYSFRTMVMEVQDKACNYKEELKVGKKFTYFAP